MHCGLGRAQGTFLWPVCITHLLGHHAAHLPVTLCAPRKSAPSSGSCEALRWLQPTSLPTSFHEKAEAQEGADLARVDSWVCTAANNGFLSSLRLRKVDSELSDGLATWRQ